MKKPTGTRFHLAILALVVVLTTGTRFVLRERQAEELQRLGQTADQPAGARGGGSLEGARIHRRERAGFYRHPARQNWGSLPLSAVQRERLQPWLRQVLNYLLHPTFEEYFRLRTEALPYEFLPTRIVRVTWTNRLHHAEAELSGQPLQVVHVLWNSWLADTNRARTSGITAVCLTNVAAATSPTNTVHALLSGPVRKGFTAAREAPNPGFDYPLVDRLPAAAADAPLYFQLSFFAKADAGGGAGPVYVSLCWLPQEQVWAPSRMLSDSWLRLNTPF